VLREDAVRGGELALVPIRANTHPIHHLTQVGGERPVATDDLSGAPVPSFILEHLEYGAQALLSSLGGASVTAELDEAPLTRCQDEDGRSQPSFRADGGSDSNVPSRMFGEGHSNHSGLL
jgi:hypothetical protein